MRNLIKNRIGVSTNYITAINNQVKEAVNVCEILA